MNSRKTYWARPNEELKDHLGHVSEMAGAFASVFGGVQFAHTCAILHDLGKYSDAFQDYMERIINNEPAKRGETIHALQGALYALEHIKGMGIADIVVNIVASHHGELLDMLGDEGRTSLLRLKDRMTNGGDSIRSLYEQSLRVPEAEARVQSVSEESLKTELGALFRRFKETGTGKFGLQLFVRMVYSCLVDADRCDAAGIDGHMTVPPWAEIGAALERHIQAFNNTTPLNQVRSKISRQCWVAGERERGIFTLSVPTGGGKTLSSLRFAIRHAESHKLKRIVYVIPYLSIIDQTAQELRNILGERSEDWILEHHSNVVIHDADESENDARRMLTERWDKPIILTTMVRFMETVVSNRASDLRKLHNMTETVFVFDEIQSLPIGCIYLFNMTVNFLCQLCGSSAVLCTATQPALADEKLIKREIKLARNHSLVQLERNETDPFKRVSFVDRTENPMSNAEIAAFASGFAEKGQSVLVVLNTKKTALDVYKSCHAADGCDKVFLSTDLCAQHRKDNIERIRQNMHMAPRRTTLCISTQLIEAGVDLSFDVVIRANAGIDNIIQAGGRCNRNGEWDVRCPAYIVEAKEEDLSRLRGIALAKQATRRALSEFPTSELTDSHVLERFYSYLYGMQKDSMGCPLPKGVDGESVYSVLESNTRFTSLYATLNKGQKYNGCPAAFARAANGFHVIEGEQIAAVVPYGPCREKILGLISSFEKTFNPKERVQLLRKLQPYTVSLYASREMWLQSISERVRDVFYFVAEGHYDAETGLTEEGFDPTI